MEKIKMKSMGLLIREQRKLKGWTQEYLAEQVNLTPRYIIDIENGSKTPKLDTLIKILNTLDTSADYVLQHSLNVGYRPKASLLESRMSKLNSTQKAQVLKSLEALVDSFL